MPYGPPLYGIFWVHIFSKCGGWSGQKRFQIRVKFSFFRADFGVKFE